MNTTYDAPTIAQIKKAVVAILSAFRGLTFLSDSEVMLEEMTRNNNSQYIIKGKYNYTSLFGSKIEEGSFELTLDQKLGAISTKVIPKSK